MSKANPKKAMAALLPSGGAVIHPMTLGMYAALERISSPLVTGKDARDTLELIPSLYLLTHDPREVFKGNILDLAMQWADSQPVSAMAAIRKAVFTQMREFSDVLPEDDGKESKKKTTDGSRNMLTGRQRHTTGALRRLCGKCQQAHSRCLGGRENFAKSSRVSSPSRKLRK